MSLATDQPGGVVIAVKAVPGARRDEIVGRLGDRLKVRVSQPAEGGKANKAICALLAAALGVRPTAVAVIRGQTSAEKHIQITGLAAAEVQRLWPPA
ncbi:MAG TPA: DUF167 domain-containing protein [Phycisphaerales bacterium]|jgi:uncharacterized protein (TIGR00251 family)|nr:DUF167 domain-containing protein [Phycisphaerales bacterium]